MWFRTRSLGLSLKTGSMPKVTFNEAPGGFSMCCHGYSHEPVQTGQLWVSPELTPLFHLNFHDPLLTVEVI